MQQRPNLVTSSCVPDVYVAEEHCVPRSWGAREERRDAVEVILGVLEHCRREPSVNSGVLCWLRLSESALALWQSCSQAAGNSSSKLVAVNCPCTAVASERIASPVCPVFALGCFPLWHQLSGSGVLQGVIGWACELSHLQKLYLLTSWRRCFLASLLE